LVRCGAEVGTEFATEYYDDVDRDSDVGRGTGDFPLSFSAGKGDAVAAAYPAAPATGFAV
jgi:hypothetical protein